MFHCRKTRTRLGRYLDGELAPHERESVENHLLACPTCRAEIGALEALFAAFRPAEAPPVPEYLTQRIVARARAVCAGTSTSKGFLGVWRQWSLTMRLAASGAAVAACYLGLALGSATVPSSGFHADDMAATASAFRDPIVAAYEGGSW